ncbi:MAG: hypothetical protein Q8M64_11570 [Methyloversatilis sp.]|nr:hypothetical protein [Methyloversatilis sp.]
MRPAWMCSIRRGSWRLTLAWQSYRLKHQREAGMVQIGAAAPGKGMGDAR